MLGKRIMIIGSCGSGKTTLALQLGEKTGSPVIHLDKEYWRSGWVETPDGEWREKQRRLLTGEYWIADGNYGGSLDIRLERADTVIFLDYNRYVCLYRILKRWMANRGKTRMDMADGCKEKIDIPFIRFVWRFPVDARNIIVDALGKCNTIKVICLHNSKETKRFLKAV